MINDNKCQELGIIITDNYFSQQTLLDGIPIYKSIIHDDLFLSQIDFSKDIPLVDLHLWCVLTFLNNSRYQTIISNKFLMDLVNPIALIYNLHLIQAEYDSIS